MLTVKLVKGPDIKIVEAVEVNVLNAGRPKEPVIAPAGFATGAIREIHVSKWNESHRVYYVSNGPVNADTCLTNRVFDGEAPVEVFDHAYIENAHGATTESVYAA